MQLQSVVKSFKFANLRLGLIERRGSGCDKCGKFHDISCRFLDSEGVARRDILVGIVGRVCGFVSIATKRATSELISPLSFSVYYIIPHLWHGRFQMDVVGGLRCLELNKESTGLL